MMVLLLVFYRRTINPNLPFPALIFRSMIMVKTRKFSLVAWNRTLVFSRTDCGDVNWREEYYDTKSTVHSNTKCPTHIILLSTVLERFCRVISRVEFARLSLLYNIPNPIKRPQCHEIPSRIARDRPTANPSLTTIETAFLAWAV
jgi:hypothetical protein